MYSLDVNFLNDRPEYKPEAGARSRSRAVVSPDDRRPFLAGALIAFLLPLLSVGALLYLQNRNSTLASQDAALDTQLGNLESKKKEIAGLKDSIAQTKNETAALATVFNQIKPWSAMMQDIRDRIPPGVQITNVKQVALSASQAPKPAASPQANAAAAPKPPTTGTIQIAGLAKSFNDVNDFLLVLQKSNFLKAEDTKLADAHLETTETKIQPVRLGEGGGQQAQIDQKRLPPLPRQVVFQIQTTLSDVPASDLLRELDRKGAAGLVTRIEALQQKGVIQQP